MGNIILTTIAENGDKAWYAVIVLGLLFIVLGTGSKFIRNKK